MQKGMLGSTACLVMASTHSGQSRPSLLSGAVLTVQSIMQLQEARWQGSKLMADVVTKRADINQPMQTRSVWHCFQRQVTAQGMMQ